MSLLSPGVGAVARCCCCCGGGLACPDQTQDWSDDTPVVPYTFTTLDTGQTWNTVGLNGSSAIIDLGPPGGIGVEIGTDFFGVVGTQFCDACPGLRIEARTGAGVFFAFGDVDPGVPDTTGFLIATDEVGGNTTVYAWDFTPIGTMPGSAPVDGLPHVFKLEWVGTVLTMSVDNVVTGSLDVGQSPIPGLYGYIGGGAVPNTAIFFNVAFGCTAGAPVTDFLVTDTGDALVTGAGDNLIWS